MRLPRDQDVLEKARALRKSMTREERHLWYDFLRGYSRSEERRVGKDH